MSTQVTKFSVPVAEIPNPKHYTETQLSGAIEVVKVQLALPDEKPVHYANRPVLEGMLRSLKREQNRRMFGAMVADVGCVPEMIRARSR